MHKKRNPYQNSVKTYTKTPSIKRSEILQSDFILTMRLMESVDEEYFLILSKEFYRLGMNLLEGL